MVINQVSHNPGSTCWPVKPAGQTRKDCWCAMGKLGLWSFTDERRFPPGPKVNSSPFTWAAGLTSNPPLIPTPHNNLPSIWSRCSARLLSPVNLQPRPDLSFHSWSKRKKKPALLNLTEGFIAHSRRQAKQHALEAAAAVGVKKSWREILNSPQVWCGNRSVQAWNLPNRDKQLRASGRRPASRFTRAPSQAAWEDAEGGVIVSVSGGGGGGESPPLLLTSYWNNTENNSSAPRSCGQQQTSFISF